MKKPLILRGKPSILCLDCWRLRLEFDRWRILRHPIRHG